MAQTIVVPACSGKAVKLQAGWSVKLINTLGSQVVDAWAFLADDLTEHMSMEHTRAMIGRVSPKKGDLLYSNRRTPLLKMTEDTSPGVHDTLRCACDPLRYKMFGYENHASCAENLKTALLEFGLRAPHSPCPFNIFENCPVSPDGTLEVIPPPVQAGQYVLLTAQVNTIVVFSACPMDILPPTAPTASRSPSPTK
ncbi:DUF1989 domain-containing protein [Bradyrhizobium sp. SRL28]|nr:DUF1989 domain-containing protein [Bradyrhizobium sp. SRL28]